MSFLKQWFRSQKKYEQPNKTTSQELVQGKDDSVSKHVKKQIEENQNQLQDMFGKSEDLKLITAKIGSQDGLICYLESMVDAKVISELILLPLANGPRKAQSISNANEFDDFRQEIFVGLNYVFSDIYHDVVSNILDGYAVLFVNGVPTGLAIKINAVKSRSIEEPNSQTIIRGPKEGFTESVGTNLSLIRRRIKNPNLRFESFKIGKDTRTSVFISYIDGICNQKIVEEVRTRISNIKASGIFDSGNIEEYIQDKTFTPFPTVYNTERPDSIASQLVSGKVAILVDGSPFVLIVPTVLNDFFQSPEDYYQSFLIGSLIRLIRYLSFMIALILPAAYVAITTYHQELLPTRLLISIISQREEVPFPAVVEVLLMEITFEIIREAGVRMPRAVGQTVSIVGALVIGQAAVEAGIISNVLVIVVALTGISSFVTPIYNIAIATRMLRFILIILASILGLFGMVLGLVVIVAHLCSLRSFGIPYLAPVAPFIVEDQDDMFLRLPIWMVNKRPTYLKTEAEIKVKNKRHPSPQKQGGDQ